MTLSGEDFKETLFSNFINKNNYIGTLRICGVFLNATISFIDKSNINEWLKVIFLIWPLFCLPVT